MTTKAVTQYLQRYAEPEVKSLQQWSESYKHRYLHVVIIPAYRESCEFVQQASQSSWFTSDALIILVINQPDTQKNSTPQQQLFQHAIGTGNILWQQQNLTLITPYSPSKSSGDILLVDRFSNPTPVKQGVGLARKIGSDLALALIAANIIQSEWICSTDADAQLPDNYFPVLATLDPEWIAACYDFEHVGGIPAVRSATLIYQQALHYYVNGLKQAGSAYAHFTIGSTLAFKASAYASVRGFPKRPAGEDFYLLNKLIKTGQVGQIEQATIQLQARLSDRVPFGTGMSTAKIMQLTKQGKPFCYYHPQIFVALRQVLQNFGTLWEERNNLEAWLNRLPNNTTELLLQAELVKFVEQQRHQCASKKQFDKQLMYWFDGLKTLRFIHGLRDMAYPDVPLAVE